MRLATGASFDRYTIEALLGEGGMAAVYKAFDTRLHRRVALKVLHRTEREGAMTTGQVVASILREARTVASLEHPNAVAIYDVGEFEGTPYLAMELIDGASLRSYVGGAAPVGERLRWLSDVAKVLAAAHDAGIVHRDIKPENVMLRKDGTIKVLDFGIARRIALQSSGGAPSDTHGSARTDPNTLVGTPAYMPPEQLRGEVPDRRTDQFGWGVLAYEILSGTLPFGAGRDTVGIIAAVLAEQAAPLSEGPEEVRLIVHRAIEKTRNARFASMWDIVEGLAPFVAGEAQPPPPSSQAPRSVPQHTTISAKHDSIVAPIGSRTEPPEVSASPPRRLPTLRGALIGVSAAALAALVFTAFQRAPTTAPPVSPVASASGPRYAPEAPTPITETPAPRTTSPEALAAYREGQQAQRDALWFVAHVAYKRAVELDPYFAAAHMRLAITSHVFSTATVHTTFQKASQFRNMLGERDQVFLDALEPMLARETPDPAEGIKRLEAAARRYPGDAELYLMMAGFGREGDPLKVLEIVNRGLDNDPMCADLWQLKAIGLERLRRFPEALDALERCLQASPAATDCVAERALINNRIGKCELVEKDARLLIAKEATTPRGYYLLAEALHALGRPHESVRLVMEQGWRKDSQPNWATMAGEIRLALLRGDFGRASEMTTSLGRAFALDPRDEVHLVPALFAIQIARETGATKDAGRAADEFLKGWDAWTKGIARTIWEDPTLLLYRTLVDAGRLSRQEYEQRRAAWLDGWMKNTEVSVRGAIWVSGYAVPAITAEDAAEALAALPQFEPLPYSPAYPSLNAMIGKVFWLAGRYDKAIPHLSRAVASCDAMSHPIVHTVANYQLGVALESRGEKAAACAAYKTVLDRFSASKRSITAKAAAARSKRLTCP